jgi:hypothetical protein
MSTDNGTSRTLFPDTTFGALSEGGDLPHADVTDLSLSQGDVNLVAMQLPLSRSRDRRPSAPCPAVSQRSINLSSLASSRPWPNLASHDIGDVLEAGVWR